MTKIKKLKLKLKSGLLSELQSDTIFGHFAWRLKEELGDEKINEFLDYYINNNPIFTISDGFFEKNDEVFFPKPFKLTPPEFNVKSKKERIVGFIEQKEAKSRKLIKVKQLNYYLEGNLSGFEKSILENRNNEYPGFIDDLRVHVEIDREKFSSKDGQLFTEKPKYLDDDTFLVVLVKIINNEIYDEYNCDEILRTVFEIGYGKKKSAGYGHFEVIEFTDYDKISEPENSNGFISLSHYLPSNNDEIDDAYYQINVKYGKFGEDKSKSQNPFKPGMLFMCPGSCFITKRKSEFYGRAVSNFNDYLPNALQNGIAFTLKCNFG